MSILSKNVEIFVSLNRLVTSFEKEGVLRFEQRERVSTQRRPLGGSAVEGSD